MHEGETIASAWGRCLTLERADAQIDHLPSAVSMVVTLDDPRSVDSIVSLGDLAAAPDLDDLLGRLALRSGLDTDLLFCEPTGVGPTVRDDLTDITAGLWRCGWSVVDCHRRVVGRGRWARHQVWGRARLARVVAEPVDEAGP